MRITRIALLAGAVAGLPGCGSKPSDPYGSMRMLTPEELAEAQGDQDSVEQAERAHNAEFVKGRKSR